MSGNRFDYHAIKELSEIIFQRYGYSPQESRDITDVLLTADLFGIESHGCQRLTLYTDGIAKVGRIKRDKKPEIVQETPVSALIEGHEYMGQIAAIMGTRIAIEKAKRMGIGMVCVKNSNHFGIAGYYARMIAKEQLLGISMTNTEAIMVPTYGRRALIGTNPIAVAMPAEPFPFLLDVATSVVPRGKLEVYKKKGMSTPNGWMVDSDGAGCVDPQRVIDDITNKLGGGILPLGGAKEESGSHKGYGFGMLVEIMTGILAGGITSDEVRAAFDSDRCCFMFLAIDYGMFGGKDAIENHLSGYLQKLRDSDHVSGGNSVLTHGQKEMLAYEKNLKDGIYLNDKTAQEIRELCGELGINHSQYLIAMG